VGDIASRKDAGQTSSSSRPSIAGEAHLSTRSWFSSAWLLVAEEGAARKVW